MRNKEIMQNMTIKPHQAKNINKQKSEKKNQIDILYLKTTVTKTNNSKIVEGLNNKLNCQKN